MRKPAEPWGAMKEPCEWLPNASESATESCSGRKSRKPFQSRRGWGRNCGLSRRPYRNRLGRSNSWEEGLCLPPPHAEHHGGAARLARDPSVVATAFAADAGFVRKPVGQP